MPRGGAFPGSCCVLHATPSLCRHAQAGAYARQQHSLLCFLLSETDAHVILRPENNLLLHCHAVRPQNMHNLLLQAQQLAGAGGCQQLAPPALPPPAPLPRWTCGLAVGGNFTCGSSEQYLQGLSAAAHATDLSQRCYT